MDGVVEEKARRIRFVLADCDGVLTDGGVYYSAGGEEMKRFSIRDGMGVERLRRLARVDVGVISGENSPALVRRAEKLGIVALYLGVKDKAAIFEAILRERGLQPEQVAFIGDDVNDVELMKRVGLAACPADATRFAREVADFICENRGGYGAFREFAELIIAAQLPNH